MTSWKIQSVDYGIRVAPLDSQIGDTVYSRKKCTQCAILQMLRKPQLPAVLASMAANHMGY